MSVVQHHRKHEVNAQQLRVTIESPLVIKNGNSNRIFFTSKMRQYHNKLLCTVTKTNKQNLLEAAIVKVLVALYYYSFIVIFNNCIHLWLGSVILSNGK